MSTASKWLSHPLTITVVSALLSLVLIPVFMQRWQNYQRTLETRATLVTKMMTTIAEPIADSRLVSRGATVGPEVPSYSQMLRTIDLNGAEVSVLLRVHFPNRTDLPQKWGAFAQALNYCIRLTAADAPARKQSHADVVRQYLDHAHVDGVDWNVLTTATWNDGFGPMFEQSYEALTEAMMTRGQAIIRDVLTARME